MSENTNSKGQFVFDELEDREAEAAAQGIVLEHFKVTHEFFNQYVCTF